MMMFISAPALGYREGCERSNWWSEGANVRTGDSKGPADIRGEGAHVSMGGRQAPAVRRGKGSFHVCNCVSHRSCNVTAADD
eukprot:1485906-Karenia_brevis.AAC.1